MSESLSREEFEKWYNEGEGSEAFKQKMVQSARDNPVPKLMCNSCEQSPEYVRIAQSISAQYGDKPVVLKNAIELLRIWHTETGPGTFSHGRLI